MLIYKAVSRMGEIDEVPLAVVPRMGGKKADRPRGILRQGQPHLAGGIPPETLSTARKLVDVLVQDFTHYELVPENIAAAREKLAQLVESIQKR